MRLGVMWAWKAVVSRNEAICQTRLADEDKSLSGPEQTEESVHLHGQWKKRKKKMELLRRSEFSNERKKSNIFVLFA